MTHIYGLHRPRQGYENDELPRLMHGPLLLVHSRILRLCMCMYIYRYCIVNLLSYYLRRVNTDVARCRQDDVDNDDGDGNK